ncbi:hypothetical protein EG68_09037 [Paragonimus skrjabini miyazakii]|uniref:Uncharacterized protein n=1 Tax=Paragonimus skrjabini miyazakii TaxID=59628 RepID=A0A8S9YUF7_9TREM|nr:hypothetical protein EG68_09037 [Paragonimus skrjabini miyazakii]
MASGFPAVVPYLIIHFDPKVTIHCSVLIQCLCTRRQLRVLPSVTNHFSDTLTTTVLKKYYPTNESGPVWICFKKMRPKTTLLCVLVSSEHFLRDFVDQYGDPEIVRVYCLWGKESYPCFIFCYN